MFRSTDEVCITYVFKIFEKREIGMGHLSWLLKTLSYDRLIKGNNKITELRAILQRESQNS